MPSPFPGMDPYLEKPSRWPDFHHRFISISSDLLFERLRPKYFVRIEERIYLSDEVLPERPQRIPDIPITFQSQKDLFTLAQHDEGGIAVIEPIVARTMLEDEVHEPRLEIIHHESREVVTVIELLSPANKAKGSSGWVSFEHKRTEIMNSPCHWVEIDLLRGGAGVQTLEALPPHEYLVHLSRDGHRPDGYLWPIRLSQRLPIIPIPLKPEDPDAGLDLQAVLTTAYDRAGYDLDVDYKREPVPPLSPEWAEWSDALLKSKGLRPS